ncbi:MAG: DMT family transporter [Ectothiorhodospiraceae bacterium]|nr:DMT family transporter [Ectothiorhodospiraceae bacterium]
MTADSAPPAETTSAPVPPPAGARGVGIALAAASATGLGLAVALSRLAYEGGSNGLTVALTRSLVFVTGIGLLCLLSRRTLRVAASDRAHLLGLGLLVALMFYGNIASVQFISVGLAALLFYTFPPMIAAIEAVVSRRLPAAGKLVAVGTAFAGLAVMLGVSFDAADPRGIGLAMAAALGAATHSVWFGRKVAHVDAMVASLYMGAVAAAVLCTVALVSGGLRWPETPLGWSGFAGVVLLQSTGLPLYLMAIKRIGALDCAVIANTQPVASIVAAYLLYSEVLGVVQLTGGAMVLAGIWLMQRSESRSRRAGAAGG